MCRVYPFQSSVTGVADVATGSAVVCACAAGAEGDGLVPVDVCAIAADSAVQSSTTRTMFFIALYRQRPLERRSLETLPTKVVVIPALESQATAGVWPASPTISHPSRTQTVVELKIQL